MKVKNTLAKNIETADNGKTALDAVCKKLLANKNILAWILKTCVKEYENCSLKEIEEKYIEGTPIVAQDAVHQDETAEDGDSVKGGRNEDSSMTEGTVTYDIRFSALNPSIRCRPRLKATVSMIINIEGQNSFYPGYPIPKRGIYYGSRMISSQYGTVFTKSHYEKIKKVYSIWICVNPPDYRKNSINIYSFHEKRLLGNVVEKKENYDLITVAMVCLGDEDDKNCKGLIRLLTVLLSTHKSAIEKKQILEEEFNIAMTRKMEKEADEMCDFGNYVEKKAIERGMAKGIAQGMEKGREQGESLLATLLSLLFADGRTDDAKAAVRDKEERRKLYNEYGISFSNC